MFSLSLAAALAWAEDVAPDAAAAPSIMPNILLFGGMFLFIYLILFRPQQKRQREHQEMIRNLQKGDRIQTSGGLLGQITGLGDQNEITVEIAPQVRVKIGRSFVARVIKPGAVGTSLEKEKK